MMPASARSIAAVSGRAFEEAQVASIHAVFAEKVKLAWQGGLSFNDLLSYAVLLEEAGDQALAAVIYRTWLARTTSPYSQFVLFNLGLALSAEGDLPGAMEAYRSAIQLSPSFVHPRVNLGLLLERLGDRDAAIAQWGWVEQNVAPEDPALMPLRTKAIGLLRQFPPAPAPAAPEPLPAQAGSAHEEVEEPAPAPGGAGAFARGLLDGLARHFRRGVQDHR